MDAAWNGVAVGEDSLSEAIKVLRKALGDDAQEPAYIQTVHRRGYRFVATVSNVSARPDPRRKLGLLLVRLGIILVALAGAAGWWFHEKSASGVDRRLRFEERDWILVSSIDNRTGETELSDVLEYALEREIGNSRFVNVVPRVRVEDTLRLMRKPLDTRLEPTVAREVCVRDGGIRTLLAAALSDWEPPIN